MRNLTRKAAGSAACSSPNAVSNTSRICSARCSSVVSGTAMAGSSWCTGGTGSAGLDAGPVPLVLQRPTVPLRAPDLSPAGRRIRSCPLPPPPGDQRRDQDAVHAPARPHPVLAAGRCRAAEGHVQRVQRDGHVPHRHVRPRQPARRLRLLPLRPEGRHHADHRHRAYVAPESRRNKRRIQWGQPHQKRDDVSGSGGYTHKTIWRRTSPACTTSSGCPPTPTPRAG